MSKDDTMNTVNVTLIKLSDNPNALRSKEVGGYTGKLPEVGASFRMYADSLTDPNLVRFIETSIVREVLEKEDGFEFRTESGTLYYLKVNSKESVT